MGLGFLHRRLQKADWRPLDNLGNQALSSHRLEADRRANGMHAYLED